MKTFDLQTKEKYVNRVKRHQEQDEIVQGVYWEKGKGCAVGCTIEGNDHEKYETELGIPRVIARIEDKIFEGLSNEEAKKFPLRFLQAVPVEVDLSMVMPKFFVWLLGDKNDGIINFAKGFKKTEKAIKGVLNLYQQTVGGKEIKKESFIKVRNAAAAAYAAATYAAATTTYAAAAAAQKFARQGYYLKMANKLIEIISECK